MIQSITNLPLEKIYTDPDFNCRQEKVTPFDVRELAEDIEKHGLIQPVVVRPKGDKYQIVVGHRRLQAFYNLKSKTIPAIIRDDLDETTARILNLSENLKRKDLNILQEAQSLIYFFKKGMSREAIAEMLDVSYGWVQIRATTLQLPIEIQHEISAGYITQTQIKDIYSLHNRDKMFEAVRNIKDRKLKGEKKALVIEKPVKKLDTEKKKLRDLTAIFRMQDYLMEQLGPSMATRVIAWIGGIISTQEILDDVMKECTIEGKEYTPPTWVEQ